MYLILSIAVIIISIAALFITLFVGKEVDKTIKTLEGVSDKAEHDKLLKANYFKSSKTNVSVLTWIYVLTFLMAIIAMIIYFSITS
jgi:hypothetical protein